jgi:hypothetical protein
MSVLIRAEREHVDGGRWIEIGQGTGFFVRPSPDDLQLITNWHIVTGRDPITGTPIGSAAAPTRLVIEYWAVHDGRATHRSAMVDLYNSEGQPKWQVHAQGGRDVDVVALRVPELEEAALKPLAYEVSTLSDGQAGAFWPTSDVSIVGFPDVVVGRTRNPVWTRATIASEPDNDFDGTPSFLVDARGRGGQSGSPVIGYWKPSDTIVLRNGGVRMAHGTEQWELLGVYSGRLSATSDLGRVWKRSALREVVSNGAPDDFLRE